MSPLERWADDWGVPALAVADLYSRMVADLPDDKRVEGQPGSEAYVQSMVRLAAPVAGLMVWRNNVGALQDKAGRFVRFGLANDSKSLNETIKSADLIGWQAVTVTQEMVGTRIARFVSIECKEAGWTPSLTDKHEIAQRRWAALVLAAGGVACFSTGGLPE